MAAGTIALTNNSTAVAGSGTSFTTELKAGDFVYANVGGAPYTLVVAAITSDTQLTMAVAFDGPTTSGLSWNAVPASIQVAITQKILNDFASVARGRILDFQNWQKIYSDAASVTVSRPDRTQFTGPSWGYMANQYAGKMDKSQNLNDVADKSTARTNLGLKNAAIRDVGTVAGTVAAGDDARLNSINGKSGGYITSGQLIVQSGKLISQSTDGATPTNSTCVGWMGGSGRTDIVNNRGSGTGGIYLRTVTADNSANVAVFELNVNGIGYAPNGWTTGSDERIKRDIKDIDPEKALKSVLSMRNVTFTLRDRPNGAGGWIKGDKSAGFLAQDLEKYLPEVVSTAPDAQYDSEGNRLDYPYQCRGDNDEIVVIENFKSIDPGKAAGALHGAAIKRLYELLQEKDSVIAELQSRMKAIDGLDA
ncbi:tail fiber domain-containing protein [Pantoea agglomerans]|uniref:tail fiber domain-containing protein n=1 Tax=Enterobacter agglomerans TaxID=549 RepID=UPI00320ACE0A